MSNIKRIVPMEFKLFVLNPFIICFHHRDNFPKGDKKMRPLNMPIGKNSGSDFDLNAEWRMYHGNQIAGFPVHPHRGFETVTVMMEGFADHFDSRGSKGRYGQGDVQWMTAGAGIQHSEMFPMVNQDEENRMEMFQVWLNLPRKDKYATPGYKMLWNEKIPKITVSDKAGNATMINLIAGQYNDVKSILPLPASWAYNRENNVGIWTMVMEPNAEFTLPAVSPTINRVLYNYEGGAIEIEGREIETMLSVELQGGSDIVITNGEKQSKLLLLEGEPIDEPMVARGPFVVNSQAELEQTYIDYQETRFGGWQWDSIEPTNPTDAGRFAYYENGLRTEYPED